MQSMLSFLAKSTGADAMISSLSREDPTISNMVVGFKMEVNSLLVLLAFSYVTILGLGTAVIWMYWSTKGAKDSNSLKLSDTSAVHTISAAVNAPSPRPHSGSISSSRDLRGSPVIKRSSAYRIDAEDDQKSSQEYSTRGFLWTQGARWQLPTAPREQVPFYGIYEGNYAAINYITNILGKYNVDPDTGFLPNKDPLQRLPYARYHLWEDLADDLPKLLGVRMGQVRAPLRRLPPLDTDKLNSDEDLRRAHLLLSLFAHAYVWGGAEPVDRIPEGIAKPLLEVSRRLDLPPVLSHTDLVLYNWRRLDVEADICMENLCTLNNFFDGRDESWFYLITTEIEARGASAIVPMLLAHDAIQRFNDKNNLVKSDYSKKSDLFASEPAESEVEALVTNVFVGALTPRNVACYVTGQLNKICKALLRMCLSLEAMSEGCHPFIFYHRVRPFLSGWKHNPTLPSGVVYEGTDGSGPEKRHFYYGGSAAQSALIPFLDICFGIDHSKSKSHEFLLAMRDYMLKPHREILQYCEKTACLREYVLSSLANHNVDADGVVSSSQGADGMDTTLLKLRDSYNNCVLNIKRFRNGHMKLVSDYIIAQHRSQQVTSENTSSAASSSSHSVGEHGDGESGVAKVKKSFENSAGGKGTGGTDLMTFLKPIRDHCTKSVIGPVEGSESSSQQPMRHPGSPTGVPYLKSNADKNDLDLYVKSEH